MNKIVLGMMVAVTAAFTGCMTEQTRRIADGEETEVTSGFAEADLRIVVSKAIQDIDRASIRYAKPDARRVINIKPFVVDTTARGSQASYLADNLKMYFEEELMNGGKFIVYNEAFAAQTGVAAVRPEFVMTGKLRE